MLDASSGVLGNNIFGEINSTFSTSLAAGRKLKSSFYWGIGVFYNCSKNELNPDADVPDPSNSSGGWEQAAAMFILPQKIMLSAPFSFFNTFTILRIGLPSPLICMPNMTFIKTIPIAFFTCHGTITGNLNKE